MMPEDQRPIAIMSIGTLVRDDDNEGLPAGPQVADVALEQQVVVVDEKERRRLLLFGLLMTTEPAPLFSEAERNYARRCVVEW